MKVCRICLRNLKFSLFYKCTKNKDGLRGACKGCTKQQTREYKDHNRDSRLARNKQYREENRHRIRVYKQGWYRANKDKSASSSAKRNASKIKRTPDWLTKGQEEEIAYMYWLARDVSLTSECKYHVDHIVPLQSTLVCGLHVPWNLQILPEDINYVKGNRYWPDMFDSEWLRNRNTQ